MAEALLSPGHTRTITQTDHNRYQKSIPSTRNRHQKSVRSHETARKRRRRCSTYAGPVGGAVLLPQKQRRRLPAHGCHGCLSVYSPLWTLWLFFSLPEASVCSCCKSLWLVHQQMTNPHLSASSKGRGDRAAEFQLYLFSPVNMSVKV